MKDGGGEPHSVERFCALCGHVVGPRTACGYGSADGVLLCHADSHSCYRRWTVYRERPE